MIPAFDYRRALKEKRDEIFAAMSRVLDSGVLVLGPEVQAFESEMARYLGAKHAVGINSGTDAVKFALECLGVKAGDEVVTVPNTAVPTVSAIRALGATVRFADVNEDSLVLDAAQLKKVITPKTRAVVAVHLFGYPVDLDPLIALTKAQGCFLIEDCAQSLGSLYRGKQTGTIADVGAYSFYPTKNLGAYGDGGMCSVNSPELAEKLKMLRMYGFRGDGHAHIEGHNSRLDELQAAVLRVKLQTLADDVARRQEIAKQYRSLLAACKDLRLPADPTWGEHSYHLFPVRTPRRQELIEAFKLAEIGYGIHYALPIPFMEAYLPWGYSEAHIPHAAAASKELFSLPMFPELRDEEIETVAKVIRKTLG